MSEDLTIRAVLVYGTRRFELPGGEHILGRSAECSVRFNDPNVSRQHVRFVVHKGRATVQDLGSKNGTRVNGRTIHGAVVNLAHNDRIELGRLKLLISIEPVNEYYVEDTVTVTGQGPAPVLDGEGDLITCAACGVVMSDQANECPHCGCQLPAGRTTCFTQELPPLFDE